MIELNGCIDSIKKEENLLVISGWSYLSEKNKTIFFDDFIVKYSNTNLDSSKFNKKTVRRADFKFDDHIGFVFEISDENLSEKDLINNGLLIIGVHNNVEYNIPIWNSLKIRSEIDNAVVNALAPGIGTISIFSLALAKVGPPLKWVRSSEINLFPGSEMPGVPASVTNATLLSLIKLTNLLILLLSVC